MLENKYDPQDSLVFLTNRVGRLLVSHIRRALEKEGHQKLVPYMGILVDLWTGDGVRQQDLVISNIKDKGAIARGLTQLEKENLLVRIPDENDKRNKRIYLTHKGKNLQQAIMPISWKILESAQTGISKEEIKTCKKVLGQMYDNLNH